MGYSNGILESDKKGGSGERGEQGLPGIGFKLTDDGNFDLDGKRLTDVSQPVDDGDATTKAYVDGEIGHHTGNFYHIMQSFTFYDSSGTELALRTDSITGLVTDYKHGYYKIPKSGDDYNFSTLDIKIRNNLPKSTYSILFYLYGYRNNSIMSGVHLGPILFSVDSTNYNIKKYDGDDSTQTRNHTKGIIWFTSDGSAGSIELGFRFFDKSITHFVILSRCVEGKVNLGFSSNIFNLSSTIGDVTLYFEDIVMNNRSINNLGGPTDDGDAANKKYVDTENAKQDKASKSYVDSKISKIPQIDTTALLPRDGSRPMTDDFDNGGNKILRVENLADYKDTDPIEYRLKDAKSVVNKEYINEKLIKKVDKDGKEYYDLKNNIVSNCEAYYDGLFTDNDLVSKKYVDISINDEISKLPKIDTTLFLPRDGSLPMTGNFEAGGYSIDGLSELVEVDQSDASVAKIKGRAIDFGYFHKQRGALKRLVELEAAKLLPKDGSDPMKGNLKMTDNGNNTYKITGLGNPTTPGDAVNKLYVDSNFLRLDGSKGMTGPFNLNNKVITNCGRITMVKDGNSPINMNDSYLYGLPDPISADDAANKRYVDTKAATKADKFVDDKIKESKLRSIMAVSQENAFLKVMDDDLFVIEDDDIHKVAVVDKKFHVVNHKTYQFKIDYDISDGYYSTRLGVSVIYLPISHYTIIFEMYFSDKIDSDQITIGSRSGTLQVNNINTEISSNHTRSVINFYKDQILPSDDELDIDIALKNKSGQSYDLETNIFVVVYGVYGTQNDVDVQVWDRVYYIENKKINFGLPVDMVNKDIENVNNLWINNKFNMNNTQIKNLGDGNENSDAVNVKQLNEMETNITNYVKGEFGKVNPVLKNNSDLIKLIYRNLIRNDSKLFLIQELYFRDSIEVRTQNNYTYQTNGDNKGDVTFYLAYVHKATTSDNMMIALHWDLVSPPIKPISIFVSKDKVVASRNPLINEPSLKSYNIPSYYQGKQLYLWITIQADLIVINFSGTRAITVTHRIIQFNRATNLRRIDVSDSPFTIQRGLITKNIYNINSDAYKDVREYEISEGTFVSAV